MSHECPRVYSLSRGRKWDSRQSRCIIGVAVVNKVVIATITNEEGVLSGIYEWGVLTFAMIANGGQLVKIYDDFVKKTF